MLNALRLDVKRKRMIDGIVSPKREDVPQNFTDFCLRYVEECKNGKCTSMKGKNKGLKKTDETISNYEKVSKKLIEFAKSRGMKYIGYGDINSDLLFDFTGFMLNEGIDNSSANCYIGYLHTIANYAEEKKLIDLRGVSFPSFAKTESDAVYLTAERVEALRQADFTPCRLNKARDIFLVGCFSGQRFSDYSRISYDNIVSVDGIKFIQLTQQKTQKIVYVPLDKRLLDILDKYDGRLPKMGRNSLNRYLKEIGLAMGWIETVEVTECRGIQRTKLKVPFYSLLTTHTARRTACTIMYKSGCSLADIMAISGHDTESNLRKYLRLDSLEKGKKAAQTDFFKNKIVNA
jgi:integrase